MRKTMSANNPQGSLATHWQSIKNVLNRVGMHPLVALVAIILLIIVPRFVILGGILYVVYWLYRNGLYSKPGRNSNPQNCGRQSGRKARRRR